MTFGYYCAIFPFRGGGKKKKKDDKAQNCFRAVVKHVTASSRETAVSCRVRIIICLLSQTITKSTTETRFTLCCVNYSLGNKILSGVKTQTYFFVSKNRTLAFQSMNRGKILQKLWCCVGWRV